MLNKILILAALISLIAVLVFAPKLLRVYKMIHLYDQDKIAFNFINMNKIFLAGPMISASEKPFKFQFNDCSYFHKRHFFVNFKYYAD